MHFEDGRYQLVGGVGANSGRCQRLAAKPLGQNLRFLCLYQLLQLFDGPRAVIKWAASTASQDYVKLQAVMKLAASAASLMTRMYKSAQTSAQHGQYLVGWAPIRFGQQEVCVAAGLIRRLISKQLLTA